MANMLPKIFPVDNLSSGERKVFEHFNLSAPSEWQIIHSFRIPQHSKVVFGESDFIIIAPNFGIFILEVKAGGVSFNGTNWLFENRNGVISSKHRGPFEQARQGMFEVERILKEQCGHEYSRVNKLYGYGVILTDESNFPHEAIVEDEKWRLFDKKSGSNYTEFIKKLAKNAKIELQKLGKKIPQNLSASEAAFASKKLRPIVQTVRPMKSFIEETESEIVTLTEEQLLCLDSIGDNPRIIFSGGAGTGKTLIAVEETKRAASEYEKVALFCYNKNLAKHLRNNITDMRVYVGTLHSYMAEVANNNAKFEVKDSTDYWTEVLPQLAHDAIKKQGIKFDKIIIDEAQDLLSDDYLNIIDAMLNGGLFDGKISFYGDFTNQAIYYDDVDYQKKLSERTYGITNCKLTINCRNTQNIGNEVINVTGFEEKNYRLKIDGEKVDYLSWKSTDEQVSILKEQLKLLHRMGISARYITVLSPRSRNNSIVDKYDPERDIIVDFEYDTQCEETTFCTIQAFKGLENQIIILTDIDNYLDSKLIYVAMSRAKSKLIVLESIAASKHRKNLLVEE